MTMWKILLQDLGHAGGYIGLVYFLYSLEVVPDILFYVLAFPVLLLTLFRVLFTPKSTQRIKVGFFHPYCDTGGGGERVLWSAVEEVMTQWPRVQVVIYTGDANADHLILEKAFKRFGIDVRHHLVTNHIRFVRVSGRKLVEASMYPRFTLIGQSIGSMLLALECLCRCTPHIWFDSTGYAFSFPVARVLFGCKVGCYVHYPTISTDMLARVWERRPTYNNDESVSGSGLKTYVKWVYYRLFALCYQFCGLFASEIMTNSTWTQSHIKSLWRSDCTIVYPPCPTEEFMQVGNQASFHNRDNTIVSVAQFRPEKHHELQLQAFAKFVARCNEFKVFVPTLVLIGGCRNDQDKARVQMLRELADELNVLDHVVFVINAPFSELQDSLSRAHVGLHTMWNEHFGIGIVEYMASGAIALAHNSGGPKADIIDHEHTGFLAETAQEYADILFSLFSNGTNASNLRALRNRARDKTALFSDEVFKHAFAARFRVLLDGF